MLVSNAVRTFLKLEGVSEESCAVLTSALQAVEGVIDVEVSIEDAIASVLYDVRVDVPRLVAAVKQAGYDARPL